MQQYNELNFNVNALGSMYLWHVKFFCKAIPALVVFHNAWYFPISSLGFVCVPTSFFFTYVIKKLWFFLGFLGKLKFTLHFHVADSSLCGHVDWKTHGNKARHKIVMVSSSPSLVWEGCWIRGPTSHFSVGRLRAILEFFPFKIIPSSYHEELVARVQPG